MHSDVAVVRHGLSREVASELNQARKMTAYPHRGHAAVAAIRPCTAPALFPSLPIDA